MPSQNRAGEPPPAWYSSEVIPNRKAFMVVGRLSNRPLLLPLVEAQPTFYPRCIGHLDLVLRKVPRKSHRGP